MKVVFFGTPEFSVECLNAIVSVHEVLAVVTQPDRARNRGIVTPSPVKIAAQALGLPLLQPERIKLELESITSLGADIGVTAAYGQILPQALLDAFPYGIINVHASLLPKYRGSSPIQWAIMNGESETGITIMQTAMGVDSGDILGVLKTTIGEEETSSELFARLSLLAPHVLLSTMQRIADGTVERRPQDESKKTHFPMLTKSMGRIDWSKSANDVHNLIRGVSAYTYHAETLLKVHASRVTLGMGACGTVLESNPKSGIVVACGEGALRLVNVQAPGAKAMEAGDYIRGHAIQVGAKLC